MRPLESLQFGAVLLVHVRFGLWPAKFQYHTVTFFMRAKTARAPYGCPYHMAAWLPSRCWWPRLLPRPAAEAATPRRPTAATDPSETAGDTGGSEDRAAPAGAAGEFVNVDEMKAARQLHSAVHLPDGRVIVIGGRGPGANLNNTVYESAEIYDPTADEWILTGQMQDQRHDLCGTLLSDGRVLAAGGRGKLNFAMGTAEVWDPATGEWSLTANLLTERDHMPCITLE